MLVNKIKQCSLTELHYKNSLIIFILGFMVNCMQYANADEIKSFGFTGYDGYIDLRYLVDDQSNTQTAPVKRSEERTAYQEEFHITTHSYIYHPKFLSMDIGGGVVFVQNDIAVNATDSSSVTTIQTHEYSNSLFDFSARLNFLTEKDYPFTLFYDRTNPLVSPSLDEQFLQKNTRYGGNFTWRTPIVYTFQTSTYESKGEGFNLIVDEKITQSNFRAHRSFGLDGYAQFLYQQSRVDSNSGSLSLDITPTSRSSKSANFDTRYKFGEDNKYEFIGLFSQIKQNPEPNLTESRLSPELRWKHSDTVKSYYKINYVKSEQQTNTTTNSLFTTGIGEQKKVGFSQQYDARTNNIKTDSSDEKVDGVSTHFSYSLPFKDGGLNLGANFNYDQRNQVATKSTIPVFNEHHVLTGTTPVDLKNKFVSSATVVVSNASRSQIFVLDTDYRLLTIGSTTQVQRLAGGSILDGEDVVIDYEYTTGGTFKSSIFEQDYQISLNFLKYYNTFARYRDVENSLDEGTPTNSLNSSETTSYGAGINLPVSTWLNFSADTVNEDHIEEIASYDRRSTKVSIQFNLPLATTLDLTSRKTIINQKTSTEDVDLTRNSARLRMRPFSRSSLTYTYSEEDDVGGSIPRSLNEHSLEFEWRFRAMTVRLNGRLVEENQGDFTRDRESVHLSIRRDF